MKIHTSTYLIVLFALLLSSCGTWLPKHNEPTTSQLVSDPAEKAKQLEIQGYYPESAQEYLRIAAQMRPPTQQGYQLSAIKAFVQANMIAEAKAELARLDMKQSYGLEIPLELVRIKIDLAEHQIEPASQRLKGIDPNTLPLPLQLEYKQLYAQIEMATGDTLGAVHQWIEVDKLAQADPNLLRKNHQQLWRTLLSYPLNDLKQIEQSPGDIFSGWVALSLLVNTTPQGYLQAALNNWQLRFPNHPANQDIIPTLLVPPTNQILAQSQPLKQVALLLPLSGKFGDWAEAIKNGFITAAEADNLANRPQINIHDVNSRNILESYDKVVKAGAEFVVGPLEKQDLEMLADRKKPQLPVPTLGLNHLETSITTGNLYQFSLSPEDEAQVVAIRAASDGHRSALVFVPEGDWGKRLLTAFQTEWEKRGGKIVREQSYGNNFEGAVGELRQNLNQGDMLFLVAFPPLARQILPLLNADSAQRLPIYSTSHIYAGIPDPERDKNLNGVKFVDMPWILVPDSKAQQLHSLLQAGWPNEKIEKLSRLHALGVDAYELLSRLRSLNSQTSFQWPGQTGHLSLSQDGKIHRDQLQWAYFVKGVPQLLNE
jgi:hypothetical protein